MDEKPQQPHIDIAEGVFFLLLIFTVEATQFLGVAAEAIGIPTLVISVIAWLGKIFITISAWFLIGLWFIMKGIRPMFYGVTSAIDMLLNFTGLDLPFGVTTAFCVTWYLTNNPTPLSRALSLSGKKSLPKTKT